MILPGFPVGARVVSSVSPVIEYNDFMRVKNCVEGSKLRAEEEGGNETEEEGAAERK